MTTEYSTIFDIGFIILLIILLLIIVTLLIKKLYNVESFEGTQNYAGQEFKWIKNPSDPKFNYISQDGNIIYVPDPQVYTNKKLYVINT